MPPFGKADQICLICLSRFRRTENDSGDSGTTGERLRKVDLYTRFLNFVGRYLQLKTTSESLLKDLTEFKNGAGGGVQPFCGSCRALVTHVCDLYGELQAVKLRLIWKLSQLGGNLKQSKTAVSYRLGRGLLKSVAKQLNFKSVRRLEMFRKALEIKCINRENNCSPRTAIPRGLYPERCQSFSAAKVMLTRLIVVFLLGSTSICMKFGRDEQATGSRSRDPTLGTGVGPNDSEVGFGPIEDTEEVLNLPWTLRPKHDMDTIMRIKLEVPRNETAETRDSDENYVNDDWEPTMMDDGEPMTMDDEENEDENINKKANSDEGETILQKAIKVEVEDNRPRNLPCPKCSKRFSDPRGLSVHLRRIHRSHIDYSCNFCSLKFKKSQDLMDHRRKVHKNLLIGQRRQRKGNFSNCTVCNEGFPSRMAMQAHRKKVHLKITPRWLLTCFECPICFRLDYEEDQFQTHLLSHDNFHLQNTLTSSKVIYCQVCGDKYDEENSLQEHLKRMHQGTFLCHCCDTKHISGPLLLEHLETHETNEKPLQCDACPQRFSTLQLFNIHRKLGHKDNARMSCDEIECSEKFTTVQELNEHLKLHLREVSAQEDKELQVSSIPTNSDNEMEESGNKPQMKIWNCSCCTRGFFSKYDLILHELVHTLQAESDTDTDIGYDCPKCRHRAQFLETLIVHYYTSHGENHEVEAPRKCPTCEKEFCSPSIFKAHLQAHQLERKTAGEMLPCDICGLEYIDGVCLRIHRSTHAQPVGTLRKQTKKAYVPRAFKRPGRPKKIHGQDTCATKRKAVSKPMRGPQRKREQLFNFSSKCTVCAKDFKYINNIWDHLRSMHETEEKPFHCWFCPKKFSLKQTAEVHRISEHRKKKFCCEDVNCEKKFFTIEELEGHLKEHLTVVSSTDQNGETKEGTESKEGEAGEDKTEKIPMAQSGPPTDEGDSRTKSIVHCQKCNWGFINPDLLQLHELVHAKVDGGYNCPKCSDYFTTLIKLQLHFDQHHTKFIHRSYQCPECGVKLSGRWSVQLHIKRHERTRNLDPNISLTCEECDYRTNDPVLLERHVKNIHAAKLFPCSAEGCWRKFSNNMALVTHVKKIHEMARELPCPICGVTYSQRKDVRAHIKAVHSDRTIVCDICGKAFKRRHYLKIHKNSVHSDEKDHICSECGMTFKSTTGLQFHIGSMHTPENEKRFGCPHCPKRYHRNMLLKMHIKTCMKMNGIVATDAAGQLATTSNPKGEIPKNPKTSKPRGRPQNRAKADKMTDNSSEEEEDLKKDEDKSLSRPNDHMTMSALRRSTRPSMYRKSETTMVSESIHCDNEINAPAVAPVAEISGYSGDSGGVFQVPLDQMLLQNMMRHQNLSYIGNTSSNITSFQSHQHSYPPSSNNAQLLHQSGQTQQFYDDQGSPNHSYNSPPSDQPHN